MNYNLPVTSFLCYSIVFVVLVSKYEWGIMQVIIPELCLLFIPISFTLDALFLKGDGACSSVQEVYEVAVINCVKVDINIY